jgi:SAM-dependent methyltransferase
MQNNTTQSIRETYDLLADEYARQLFNELKKKPLDRELLDRFAAQTAGRGQVCAGATVFGLDLSSRMIEEARKLNSDICFHQGNIMALDLANGELAGIAAFYAIVNIPKESLPLVFKEMERVLQPGGLLLLAFHTGDETLHPSEFWGRAISMDWYLFPTLEIRCALEKAGFAVEDIIEREPYAPEVEHQSRRAYIFARKPSSS